MKTATGGSFLIVADPTPNGGTEIYLKELAAASLDYCPKLTLAVPRDSLSQGTAKFLSSLTGLTLHELQTKPGTLSFWWEVRRLSPDDKGPGVSDWDFALTSSGDATRLIFCFPRAKRRYYLAHTYPRGLWDLFSGPIFGLVARLYDRVLIVSTFSAKRFLLFWKLPKSLVAVLPPPDVADGLPLPPQVEKRGGVLGVGSLETDKNPLAFVEAAHYLRMIMGHDTPHFTWVGSGALKVPFLTRVRELNLESHVSLIPEADREEIGRLYSSSEVLLNLSRRESLGLVTLEAARSGIWQLSSSSGGLAEGLKSVVRHKKCEFQHGALIARELHQLLLRIRQEENHFEWLPQATLESNRQGFSSTLRDVLDEHPAPHMSRRVSERKQ